MAQTVQQIKLAKQAEQAVRARRAPTAKQAERAKQASRAIRLDELKYLQRQNKNVETFLSNYNDPTELNSYIDALTNREAVSKKFGETWGTISTVSGTTAVLSFAGSIIAAALAPFTGGASLAVAAPLAKIGAVSAIPAIPAAVDVTIEKGIKPILAGKPEEALLNTLMNVGETADFIANPVKGLILEGGKGFIKGTGLAEGGRVNYDYDTGFFLTDMLLEAVSDPLNWVQFGTNTALKTALKTPTKNIAMELTDTVNNVLTKELAGQFGALTTEASERVSKAISKAASQTIKDLGEASVSGAVKDSVLKEGRRNIQRALARALKKELPEASWDQIDQIIKHAGRSARTGQFARSVYNQIQNIPLDKLVTDTIKNLSSINYYTNAAQKFMTKQALRTSGYGVGIDLAKRGFNGIKTWASNRITQALTTPRLFNTVKGLDLTRYEEAKNVWLNVAQYTEDITGEIAIRDENAFYVFVTQQLNRDKQLIYDILEEHKLKPMAQAAALDSQFTALYGCDFKTYISYIKGINTLEHDRFATFINNAEAVYKTLPQDGAAKQLGTLKTGAQIYSARSTEQFMQRQTKTFEDLRRAIDKNNQLDFSKKIYTLKLNNEYVNAVLVNDPLLYKLFMQIESSEQIGALLNNIISDTRSLDPEVSALIPDAVRTIKEAGASFMNIKRLYDDAARILTQFPADIKGLNGDDFVRYFIDAIFGLDKTVPELLAGFDITMDQIIAKLENVLLAGTDFRMANYPALRLQMEQVLKAYLEAQDTAGLKRINAAIVENFTKSVDDLINAFPQYADELMELGEHNKYIKGVMSSIKSINQNWIEAFVGNENTIFKDFRKLSDVGLAVQVIDLKDTLDLFELPADITGSAVTEIQSLGKALKHLTENLEQFSVTFTPERKEYIDQIYSKWWEKVIANPDKAIPMRSFKYLRRSDSAITQFAQLSQYYKSLGSDDLLKREFRQLFDAPAPSESFGLLKLIADPSSLMVTDFAWDAMAQSAAIAEKQLNEYLINGITAFKGLSALSKKATNDFETIREYLSHNKLDRPLMLQQERYIKAASKVNDLLGFVESYYDELFDYDIAKTKLNELREALLMFPDLDRDYADTVNKLERYWNGEELFQQSPKYMRGSEDFVDTFTPFYEEVKVMNRVLNAEISNYNQDVAKGLTDSTTQLKYISVSPWDPVRKQQEFTNRIKQATTLNAQSTLYNLFQKTPQELIEELAHRRRFITFTQDDIKEPRIQQLYNRLQTSASKNEELFFFYDKNTERHWVVLDKNQTLNAQGRQIYLNGRALTRVQNVKRFDELKIVDDIVTNKKNPGFVKTFNELDDTLYELTGSRLGDSQGEYLSKETIQKVYDQMPEAVKEHLDIDELLDNQFFDAYYFNESVLGSASSKAKLGMYSSNLITNLKSTINQTQAYLKPKNEYVHSIFNSQMSIASPNSVWKYFSDEDLLEALQNTPDYKLIALVDDKKYGMKVREIYPTSIASIKKAKELGAVVVPLQTYKDMYNVVNHRLGSTGLAKWWARIMYTYKFGYLCRPGAWIRNWIDTNIKSKFEMGEEYSSYQAQAHKILDEVDEIKDFVQRRSNDGVIKSDALKQYFGQEQGYANLAKHLTYEQFIELDRDFLSQGISGNIMADLYATEGEGLWSAFTHTSGKIIDTANKTENYNRLAMYLYGLDQGLDYTSALSKLAKTHFDYSFKSKAEQLVDLIFPFSTFSMRNYSYWIEMIEKHPWIMRNYVHLMKPHWDFKDYTPEELARDYRVQNQILYGQLKLGEFNNKVITFKANPSIQNAIQMFSDPINTVYENLAAPISVPLKMAQGEYTQPLNLIPIAGPAIQSVQTMLKSGTPIPSAIGIQKAPKRTGRVKFSNPNLSGTNKFTDNTYRTPKYRNNIVYDSYSVKGIKQYRVNLYPVIDIAHDIKMRYSTNVYNRVKNKVKTDVYQGIRYRLRLDANRFR